jgi:hypothetical protein
VDDGLLLLGEEGDEAALVVDETVDAAILMVEESRNQYCFLGSGHDDWHVKKGAIQ